MSRAVRSFKKCDIAKAYKAIVDAGGVVSRVEVDGDGRIIIVIGKPSEQSGSESN
jgi:hypothetical protein